MIIFDLRDYIVPRFAIEEYGLKGNELLVYSFLFTYTDEGKSRVFCTTEDFEEATNISRQSLFNVLGSLRQKGLIKIEKFILFNREHFGYSVKTPKNYKESENGK